MPNANPVPTALAEIDYHNVNNDKKHRQELIDCVENLTELIDNIATRVKDSEYQEFYTYVEKLWNLKDAIKTTIIYQTIKHKHNLDRNPRAKPKNEAEKIKLGYIRCKRCDALLRNKRSLSSHIKRNICKKVLMIKDTVKVIAKPDGAKEFSRNDLRFYKSTFPLFTAYNDKHIEMRYNFSRLGIIITEYNYETELNERRRKEQYRNLHLEYPDKPNYSVMAEYSAYYAYKRYY